MAPKRKSDDMNVVLPVKNEKSTRSGGNDSIKSDHYGKIVWGWNLFGDRIRWNNIDRDYNLIK